ncbi:MAG: hypothetical protein K2L89_06010, partial [Muribaculaceae bacterium]|nr:hypothetical protein [Muribaculaceae bacterium]
MSKIITDTAFTAAMNTLGTIVKNGLKEKADIDETTRKVVPDQLPVPVVRFKGFYIGLKDPVGQSMGAGDYEILYHRGKNTFVAVRTGVANPDPFSNFPPDITKYQEGPLQNPF